MTKQVRQAITPTHILGSTGTAEGDDLGFRALASLKADLSPLAVSVDLVQHGLTIGRGSGASVTNTVVGNTVLVNNTTGVDNTAYGFGALFSNTEGNNNTAIGYQCLDNNTTGIQNTATGRRALRAATTGSQNTALGHQALITTTTGVNNTGIGTDAVAAAATSSNTITLGNSAITTLRCQVTTITALSDARDKTNIKEIPVGLSFVQALRPVSFDWNMRDGGKVGVPEFGFIAQELQAAQADAGVTVPNLVYDDNPEKLEAGPSALIPVLVKAIQEQQAQIQQLRDQISTLKGN